MTKRKFSLKQIENAIEVVGGMSPQERQTFIANVDSLKGLKGEKLDERISKATAIQYALFAY